MFASKSGRVEVLCQEDGNGADQGRGEGGAALGDTLTLPRRLTLHCKFFSLTPPAYTSR